MRQGNIRTRDTERKLANGRFEVEFAVSSLPPKARTALEATQSAARPAQSELSRSHPVSVIAAGKFYGAGGVRTTVTAGVIAAGYAVPDLATATPVSPAIGDLAYQVYVFDKPTGQSLQLSGIESVTGSAPWSLDLGDTTAAPAAILLRDTATNAVLQLEELDSALVLAPAAASAVGLAYSQPFTDTVTGQFFRLYAANGIVFETLAPGAGTNPTQMLVDPDTGVTHVLSFARGFMRLDPSETTGLLLLADVDGSDFWTFSLTAGQTSLVPIDCSVSVPPLLLADSDGTGRRYQLVANAGVLYPVLYTGSLQAPASITVVDSVDGTSHLLTATAMQFSLL